VEYMRGDQQPMGEVIAQRKTGEVTAGENE
jgi:hypothetical protein